MTSVYCVVFPQDPNHCVVVGEEVGNLAGVHMSLASSCNRVTQMVKFLWIFEIVNFYEIAK